MPRTMAAQLKRLSAVAFAALACAASLSACGGGDGLSGDAVAKVGNVVISRATLSHWMESVVGGDYYEHVSKTAPRGLVSDPPNYSRCVAAAAQIVPKLPDGQPSMTPQQLTSRCRALYRSLKEQALTLLISFATRTGEGAEEGIHPTKADLDKMFARVKAEQFPQGEAQYQAYLAPRDWVPSDEMTQLKRNYISAKIEEKFKGTASGTAWQRPYVNFILRRLKEWKAKTTCRQGYIVPQCKEFKGPEPIDTRGPALELEELAGLTH